MLPANEINCANLWDGLAVPQELRPPVLRADLPPGLWGLCHPPRPWLPAGAIELQQGQEEAEILIHETAHHLLNLADAHHGHGPAFLALHLILLRWWSVASTAAELRTAARQVVWMDWHPRAPRWLRRAALREAARIYNQLAADVLAGRYKGNGINLATDVARRLRWWWHWAEPATRTQIRPATLVRHFVWPVAWLSLLSAPMAWAAGAPAGACLLAAACLPAAAIVADDLAKNSIFRNP
ncbi:MAG: hypothetical protein FHP92_12900 [Denitromonas halophila]|nr:MAG: hypothetical protein FHP92_12900 [Denitromonas halophila]